MERHAKLKKYKEKHGHYNVPHKHGLLGKWVVNQRKDYPMLKEGKSSRMSDDRIHKLDSIRFQWSLRLGGDTVQWDARFQELKK